MLLNNQWKQKQEIKIYLETNEDGNRAFQDLWDTEKTFLRGKCIAIQATLGNSNNLKQSNLTHKELEKE